MIVTCTRRLQFCAGHRVMGHETKCAHLHGHNYVALFTAKTINGNATDGLGRVIDFSIIKNYLSAWIEVNWDHGMILNAADSTAIKALELLPVRHNGRLQKLFLLPDNPTAENLAKYLIDCVCPGLFEPDGVKIINVELWETENCKAEVSRV